MNKEIKLLYRKVNSKARGCHHNTGPDARYDRNTKNGLKKSMSQGKQRGLDYTPLYRFLHSKVGQSWDKVYSEAISRLPKGDDAIFSMVILEPEINTNIGRNNMHGWSYFGESTIMSTMTVDEDGLLQFIKPNLKNEDFSPSCWCCTHTFNSKPLIKKYGDHHKRFPQD